MEHSDQLNELAPALAKAQGQMSGAEKSAANPFFKSKYADLASVWDACRKPLSDNGLSLLQSPSTDGVRVSLDTLLLHTSGQWIKGTVSVSAKEDSPQAVGSCITYLRRYALQSFAGVAPEDDDAEAAEGRPKNGKVSQMAVAKLATPAGYPEWLADLAAVVCEGTPALQATWQQSKPAYRQHLIATDPKQWESMKKAAGEVAARA